MASFLKTISVLFCAGVAGGLANAVVAGSYQSMVNLASVGFSKEMIYARMVWGGLWGFLFAFSRKAKNLYMLGLAWSLVPTLVQLLVVFPARGQGVLGASLGEFTFIRVILFNAVWGLVAAFWIKRSNAG
jgi:hypothetical protein